MSDLKCDTLIYDVTDIPFWGGVPVGLCLIISSWGFFLLISKHSRREERFSGFLRFLVGGACAVFLFQSANLKLGSLKKYIEVSDYVAASGMVRDVIKSGPQGRAVTGSFIVDKIKFTHNFYNFNGGFKNCKIFAGCVVEEGMAVKVLHKNRTVLKIFDCKE